VRNNIYVIPTISNLVTWIRYSPGLSHYRMLIADSPLQFLYNTCSKLSYRYYNLMLLTSINYTSQQDFGTRKVYCVSNVTFHAESKYAIKIFSSSTVFVQWPF